MNTWVACCWVCEHVLLVPDGEVIVTAGTDLVLAAQHALEVHHPLLDGHAVLPPGPTSTGAACCRTPGTARSRVESGSARPDFEPAGGALRAQHAGDLERNARGSKIVWWIMRGRVGAEHLGHRRAEHRVPLARGVVAVGEHPAVGHRVVPDVDVVGRGADDLEVAVLVAEDHLQRLLGLGHDGLEQRGIPCAAPRSRRC